MRSSPLLTGLTIVLSAASSHDATTQQLRLQPGDTVRVTVDRNAGRPTIIGQFQAFRGDTLVLRCDSIVALPLDRLRGVEVQRRKPFGVVKGAVLGGLAGGTLGVLAGSAVGHVEKAREYTIEYAADGGLIGLTVGLVVGGVWGGLAQSTWWERISFNPATRDARVTGARNAP